MKRAYRFTVLDFRPTPVRQYRKSMGSATPHPVQRLREEQALSREGLAFKAGLSYRTIERIETGAAVPQRATLRVVADALGVDVLAVTETAEEAA